MKQISCAIRIINIFFLFSVALPDALENNCRRCNNNQKKIFKKIIKKLVTEKPEMWAQLEMIYDKDGKFRKMYGTRNMN